MTSGVNDEGIERRSEGGQREIVREDVVFERSGIYLLAIQQNMF